MQVGDSVILKRRVRDYWSGKFLVGGWQGRIHRIGYSGLFLENGDKELEYVISYDSITLKNMPAAYIKAYLKRGDDFRFFIATVQHFSMAKPRDTIKDMMDEWQILEQKYHYEEILEEENSNLCDEISEDDDDDFDGDGDEDDDWDDDEVDDNEYDEDSISVLTKAELWIAYEASLINNKHNFKEGDTVVVKPGVKCVDNEKFDMGGWQGRITCIYEPEITPGRPFSVRVEIDFDSITLRQMPDAYIKFCLKRYLDFRCDEFYVQDIEASLPRDTKAELIATRLELDKKYDYAAILNLDIDEPEHLLYMDKEDFN